MAAIERSLKRGRVERPRRGEQTPTETVWTVSWALSHDEDAIAAERRRASCFVLLTDHIDEDDWGDAAALAA